MIRLDPIGLVHTIVWDLDNTLIEIQALYDRVTDAFSDLMHTTYGVEPDVVEALRVEIDVPKAQAGRFDRFRLAESMMQTAETLTSERRIVLRSDTFDRIRDLAGELVRAEYEVYPGVTEILAALRAAGVRQALCTLGDPVLQHHKLDRTGLRQYFDHVAIAPNRKGPDQFRNAALRAGAEAPHTTVVIGDSLAHDIAPAQMIGARTVWVEGHRSTWSYNAACAVAPDLTLDRVGALADHLPDLFPGRSHEQEPRAAATR